MYGFRPVQTRSYALAGSGILHRYIHKQGQRPLTTLNLFARSSSTVWYDLIRPHTCRCLPPPRVRPRGKCVDFFAQLCNTRVETRAEFARVKRVKRNTHRTFPLLQPRLLRDAMAKHYRTCSRWRGEMAFEWCIRAFTVSRFYIISSQDECKKAAAASQSHRDC